MPALEIALRAIGAFYVFAGIAGMRAVAMDHLMDQLLAGITLQPVPDREVHRRWLATISTLAVGTGGMALMVLSLWAVPLSLVGAGTQAAYLLWARTAFPVADEAGRKARAQVTNAALVHGLATALVCAAALAGMLRGFLDPWALLIPATGLLLLAVTGRHFLWRARRVEAWSEPERPEPDPLAPPRAVALHPRWGGATLVDTDRDEWLDYDLFVPAELSERIWRWGHAFHAGDDHQIKEFWVQFTDAEHEVRHRAEGEAIVAALRGIFGEEEAAGPIYPSDIRYGVGED